MNIDLVAAPPAIDAFLVEIRNRWDRASFALRRRWRAEAKWLLIRHVNEDQTRIVHGLEDLTDAERKILEWVHTHDSEPPPWVSVLDRGTQRTAEPYFILIEEWIESPPLLQETRTGRICGS